MGWGLRGLRGLVRYECIGFLGVGLICWVDMYTIDYAMSRYARKHLSYARMQYLDARMTNMGMDTREEYGNSYA